MIRALANRLGRFLGQPTGAGAGVEAMNASADLILRCGLDGQISYVSPSALEITGYTPAEFLAMAPAGFVHKEDLHLIERDIAALRAGDLQPRSITYRLIRKDRSEIWVEARIRTVMQPGTGAPSGVVVVLRDISAQKLLQDQLRNLALTDGLTGLANRRAFDETIARECARCWREQTQLSLLLIDIDHFKSFNDQYGHQKGDDCIRQVGAALSCAMRRPGDLAARYGGDELAAILPGTDSAGAGEVANNLLRQMRTLRLPHPQNPEGGGLVSVSIGAATALCRSGGTVKMPRALLAAADGALYSAKSNGRDRAATALLFVNGLA